MNFEVWGKDGREPHGSRTDKSESRLVDTLQQKNVAVWAEQSQLPKYREDM